MTGGPVMAVASVDDRSDLWELTITPDSSAEVAVVLPLTTDCAAPSAVCTVDDRWFSHGLVFGRFEADLDPCAASRH